MDIATFTTVAPSLPADIAILVRGPHGIGKSQIFRQIARSLGFKAEDFIDRDLKTVRGVVNRIRKARPGKSFKVFSFTNFYDNNTFRLVHVHHA